MYISLFDALANTFQSVLLIFNESSYIKITNNVQILQYPLPVCLLFQLFPSCIHHRILTDTFIMRQPQFQIMLFVLISSSDDDDEGDDTEEH